MLGLALLPLPKCGQVASEDDGGQKEDAPEVALDDPFAVGEAYCRRVARCEEGLRLLVYPGGTLEACLADVGCFPDSRRRLRYRAGCARAMDELPCEASTRDACQIVGEAKLELGDPCTTDTESPRCREGLWCPPEFNGCSRCERLAGLGEACSEGQTFDASGKLVSDPVCPDELDCSPDTGRCVPRPIIGEPCRFRNSCAEGRCVDGLCVARLPTSPTGGPCADASGNVVCEPARVCE